MNAHCAFLAAVAAGILAAATAAPAAADPITLENRNSTVVIDPYSQFGQMTWTVDGTNHLAQQWFWCRVRPDEPERSIETLDPNPVVFPSDTSGDEKVDNVRLTYTGANPDMEVSVNFNLMGGRQGSGKSDLAITLRVDNLTSSPLEVHLFHYADFDLNGRPGADTAYMLYDNTVIQKAGPVSISETVLAPHPSRHEVNLYPVTLKALNDPWPTLLSGENGPVTGNATWAFQWDVVVEPDGTFIVSADESLRTPEPATLALLGLGVAGIVARRRSKK